MVGFRVKVRVGFKGTVRFALRLRLGLSSRYFSFTNVVSTSKF